MKKKSATLSPLEAGQRRAQITSSRFDQSIHTQISTRLRAPTTHKNDAASPEETTHASPSENQAEGDP